jgi:hypothetical protein
MLKHRPKKNLMKNIIILIVLLTFTTQTTGGIGPSDGDKGTEILKADKSLVYLRFPELVNKREQPKLQIHEDADSICLYSEITQIVFSRKTCSISCVKIRDKQFNKAQVPELQILDTSGKLYLQDNAQDGDLRKVDDHDGSISLAGRCTPKNADGAPWGSDVDFNYIIHPITGVILLKTEVCKDVPEIVELTFANTLSDRPEDNFNEVYYMHSNFQPVYKEIPSRADAIEDGKMSHRAMWCAEGKMALHIESMSLADSQYASSVLSDPDARKYTTVETRNGRRYLNQTFVNMPEGTKIAAGTKFEYSLAVLPMRRFKPYIEFYGEVYGLTTEAQAREIARSGMTCAHLCLPYAQGGNPGHADAVESARLARKYGMKVASYWESNLLPQADEVVEKSFFTKQEMDDAQVLSTWLFGKSAAPIANPGCWPHNNLGMMCRNDRKWQEFLAKQILLTVDHYDLEGVYVDGMGSYPCENTAHGCRSPTTYPMEGQMQFVRLVQEGLKARPDQRFFMAHVANIVGPSLSSCDFYNPGEETGGAFLTPAQADCVYNPMLDGNQKAYYTANMGLTHDDPVIYEYALARCAVVWLSMSPGWEGRFTPEQLKLYQRYMCPLKIFNVDNSTLHHPYDHDFDKFCRNNMSEVSPVLYARSGDVLLTASITYAPTWTAAAQDADPGTRSAEEIEVKKCRENLGILGQALNQYAQNHGGFYPTGGPGQDPQNPYSNPQSELVKALYPDYIKDPNVFYCPAGYSKYSKEILQAGNISYFYWPKLLGDLKAAGDPKRMLMSDHFSSKGDNHGNGAGNAVFAGGYVKWRKVLPPYYDADEAPDEKSPDALRSKVNRELVVKINLNEPGFTTNSEKVLIYDTLSKQIRPSESSEGNWLFLKDLSVGRGPAILRILRKPEQVEAIWHDHLIWRIMERKQADNSLVFELAGLPSDMGQLVLYVPAGKTVSVVSGGAPDTLITRDNLLFVKVPFSDKARASLELNVE